MALPKRKTSKRKVRVRRAAHAAKVDFVALGKCSQCGAPKRLHRICPSCGYYKGKQVLSIETA